MASTANNSVSQIVKPGQEGQALNNNQMKAWTGVVLRRASQAMKDSSAHTVMTRTLEEKNALSGIQGNKK